jgi:hypothetical protein
MIRNTSKGATAGRKENYFDTDFVSSWGQNLNGCKFFLVFLCDFQLFMLYLSERGGSDLHNGSATANAKTPALLNGLIIQKPGARLDFGVRFGSTCNMPIGPPIYYVFWVIFKILLGYSEIDALSEPPEFTLKL